MGGHCEVIGQFATMTYEIESGGEYAAPQTALWVAAIHPGMTPDELDAINSSSSSISPVEAGGQAHLMRKGKISAPVYYGGDARVALEEFLSVADGSSKQLEDLILYKDEVMVPTFGSPPSGWESLRKVCGSGAHHVFLVSPAIGFATGGVSVWTLAFTYAGSQIFARVINPVLSETGEGLRVLVRKAFKLDETDREDV
ncbi:hypothetical protein ACFV1L_21300 [Kitasatospora sp. NPDC059646]|uniref:hypothetical protein n=1 Tax=Kitasatospora sp. NPDC059646 TaxID=3346893 RepID=UPI0036A86557